MSENPYQPFFDKLDETIGDLEAAGADDVVAVAGADLLRRAGFVLANLLNVNAQVLPTLILPAEGEVTAPEPPDNEGV